MITMSSVTFNDVVYQFTAHEPAPDPERYDVEVKVTTPVPILSTAELEAACVDLEYITPRYMNYLYQNMIMDKVEVQVKRVIDPLRIKDVAVYFRLA